MGTIEKSPHLAWRIVSGQAFVINTKTSMLHELDEVATFIWKVIDEGTTRGALLSSLIEVYEVTPAQAERDIDEFLITLKNNGLISGI